jgi:sirohydrochlorin ferrochelatase
MKALLIVAHGSRRAASNEEVQQLAERLAQIQSGSFDVIDSAFLELAEPSIPDGIRKCVDAGATEVIVLPYFLSAGRHVAEDVPELVDEAKAQMPDVEITLLRHLGASEALADLMLQEAGA